MLDPSSCSGRSLDAGNLIVLNASNATLGTLLENLAFSAHLNQKFDTTFSLRLYNVFKILSLYGKDLVLGRPAVKLKHHISADRIMHKYFKTLKICY